MSDLQKLPPTLDSREVAEMVGKRHAHLCRDIAGYIKVLTESNFGFSDFFIEASYKDASGIAERIGLRCKTGAPNAAAANQLLASRGLQERRGKDWHLTEKGKRYGEAKPYERGGHSGYQIVWSDKVIAALN